MFGVFHSHISIFWARTRWILKDIWDSYSKWVFCQIYSKEKETFSLRCSCKILKYIKLNCIENILTLITYTPQKILLFWPKKLSQRRKSLCILFVNIRYLFNLSRSISQIPLQYFWQWKDTWAAYKIYLSENFSFSERISWPRRLMKLFWLCQDLEFRYDLY